MKNPDFDKIVEKKVAHYGHTRAAYEFAAEEYRGIMNKLTSYQDFLGKTIAKIEDDTFEVRFIFTDGTYALLIGDRDGRVSLCEFKGKDEELVDPTVYE